MCELDFDLIIRLTAYRDTDITFLHSIHDDKAVITTSDYTISAQAAPMELIFDPSLLDDNRAAKFTKSSLTDTGYKVKNTITYQSTPKLATIKAIASQVKLLHRHSYHIIAETVAGTQFLIRSTPDTFHYDHTQEQGIYHSTIIIENISGAQLILPSE